MASKLKCTATRHRFMRPVKIVGGCSSNPGVHFIENGMRTTEVCCNCGCYKYETYDYSSKRTKVEYREADELSLEWVDRLERR